MRTVEVTELARSGDPPPSSVQPHGTVVMRQTVWAALPVGETGQGDRALRGDRDAVGRVR